MASLFQRFRQRLRSNAGDEAGSQSQPVQITTESAANEPLTNEASQQEAAVVVEQQAEQISQEPEPSPSQQLETNEENDGQNEEPKDEANQVDEEVASTIPEEPQPSRWRDDLYIQTRKNFQRTTKEAFALNQFMSEMPPILPTDMQHYRSVNTAIFIQSVFHNFALILQGFLSGFALFHTVMAFSFADVASLVKGYSHMAAPMHAAFYFCFVISAIDAMDRFETGGTWRETLSRWIGLQRGGLALLISICGTCATVVMTKFEEYLATDLSTDTSSQQTISINIWHWLSAVRAACAVSGWLLIALQPTANFTRDQLIAMAPELQTNGQFGASNMSSESNRLANARGVISSLANSVARLDRLDLSQDFLTSIKVLAAHQAKS
ncbi:hypothetical protein M3Y97_00842900 [Aphelenchoides bicaudatus]|nr:hypothetical protein M3Y97_00842900 [Aphelenchoides bicaudatus]